jgi:hypothetical protein
MLSEKILYGELRAGEIVVVDTEGTGKDEAFTFTGASHAELDDPPLSDVQDDVVPATDVQDGDTHDRDIPDDIQHADVQKNGIQGTDFPDTVTTPDAPDPK